MGLHKLKTILALIFTAIALHGQGSLINYQTQLKNQPRVQGDVSSPPFADLTEACAAANKLGLSLQLSKTWVSSSQTLTCPITVAIGGMVKPSSGQTVTFTLLNPGAQQVCDISLGGSCHINSITGVYYPEMWGALADGVITGSGAGFTVDCTNATDNQNPLAAAFSTGANIKIRHKKGAYCFTGTLGYQSQQSIEGVAGMQSWSSQTIYARKGTSTSPLIQPTDLSTNTVGVTFRNIALLGQSYTNPVINWYRTSSGRLDQVYIEGTSGNAIVVDADSGQAYFNIFSQVNLDGPVGCGFLFQNGANGNQIFGGRAIWSGMSTSTCGAIKFTSLSADNTVYGFDAEGSDTMGATPPSQLYWLDSPQNSLYGVHGENGTIGFNITDNASASRIDGSTFASTVVTPFSCATAVLCARSIINDYNPAKELWDNSVGFMRSYGATSSGGSSHFWTLYPQDGTGSSTEPVTYYVGYGTQTSGNNLFKFYSYHTQTAQVDLAAGAWAGNGDGSFHAGLSGFFTISATDYKIITQGWQQTTSYAAGGTTTSFDNILQSNTANSIYNLFLNQTTSGTKQFNIYKGDGTNTLMFQVNAATGAIKTTGGDVGITGSTCSSFHNGLCVAP